LSAKLKSDYNGIKAEFNSLIRELEALADEIKADSDGINENRCANVLDNVADDLRKQRSKLEKTYDLLNSPLVGSAGGR